ncbi:hypothetical protein BDV96DRAFT_215823 [Lophiotrema nucula]|uniref:Uncharacterized protein n=1 Tax=Lophiotrema nucula TaxID=690887 RepID=A0A6A5ZQV1_9PLEO|nr:hypothetical protein BDV96DRAFT_215823 [Lophiotrema nucula]
MPSSCTDEADRSDNSRVAADTDPELVMAEQITHDVVKQAQSVGGPAPIDDPATTTNVPAGYGDAPSAPTTTSQKPSDASPPPTTNAPSRDADQIDGARPADKADDDTPSAPVDQTQLDTAIDESREPLVNGDAGDLSPSEDVASQQALGDVSGGSDTDISRPGSVDPAKERPAGHLRSNSVKKPASFKSVSVTKNFLAKSAVSTPVPGASQKPPPVGQTNASILQTTKPRLVAKAGPGLGSLQRGGVSKLNGTAGPDASKVWNKNQPVPLPPPKQFTDEELKQQYGIHLATRLQADDSNKEAKWADIDDDEDDWAPDTVQWMDGTKSTVAAVENQAPPPEEMEPVTEEAPPEAAKPTPPPAAIAQRPTSTTGTKTILKPGAHSQASGTKAGLTLKGQPEKPTLVAKPSGSTPSKSPWATLPPVEKVPLVQINPPVQQPLSSRFSQDARQQYDAFPSASHPAKEIAPDDFNRSWRDDRGNRELFNSHSGRYEPVHETRRGSIRDNNFRQQPSVLQRPSQDGPAEPSAAFQTSRTSADGPGWGRRRNSSIVSGGSGRRMSFDRRGPDLPSLPLNIQRRGSQSINGSEATTPASPRLHFAQKAGHPDGIHAVPEQAASLVQKPSPSLANVQPASPYGSTDSPVAPDGPAAPAPAQVESAVEVQNRLMREKLERARLQKQKEREREEKEEAERKERLRKKLEALGMTDDPKSKVKEQEKSPLKDKAVPAPVQSPPKPPVPTSEGEVAQYGMMKVHQAQPVKTAAQKPWTRGAEVGPKPVSSPVKAQSEIQPKPAPSTEVAPQPLNNLGQDERTNKQQLDKTHGKPDTRVGNQDVKPTAQGWAGSIPQQPRGWTSNVWGPPQAKDRALGNGTFDSGYTRGQPRPGPQQLPAQPPSSQPAAIGTSAPLKPSPPQAQGLPNQPFAPQTMPVTSQQPNLGPPGPIAPPTEKHGWNNFASAIRLDDQAVVAKNRQELERLGEAFRPELREIYTDKQGKSQKALHSRIGGPPLTNGTDLSSAATVPELKGKDESGKPVFPAATSVSDGSITQAPHQPHGQTGRSSRFFPRASEAAQQSTTASNVSDSPPPPETESHPAFTGDSHHPVVKMPMPPPRVRLPPPASEPAAPSEAPVTMPPRVRVGLGARPLALDPEWQARFNSLLEKSAPGGKGPAPIQPPHSARPAPVGVAASSKAPLEVRENKSSATVSLPNAASRKIFVEDSSSEVTTRLGAEGVLLEEREFGSLPIVKLSKVPHLAANEAPIGFPNHRPNSRFHPRLDIFTKGPFHAFDTDGDTVDVVIRLASMKGSITKSIPRKRASRKYGGPKPKRAFTPSNNNGSSNSDQKDRLPRKSSGYQGRQNSNQSSSRQSTGGSSWPSNRSSPPNNGTWARRAAAAPVH